MLPIFDIRCSYQLVNLNIQVGVAARNIEFGNNLTNFDSSCTLNSILGVIPSAYYWQYIANGADWAYYHTKHHPDT